MDLRENYRPLQRGWCLGDAEFRQELLDQMEARRGKWSYGEELCESAEHKAERLVKTALRQSGWKETTWRNGAREDPVRIKIALQLREQSVMTMEWIAQRLQTGTRTYLNHLLYCQWQRANVS
jgi:hypothetical protein